MILLFNLNRYIGGGETLLIRLAQHLHDRDVEYEILCANGKCWIQEEASKRGLNYSIWPSIIDSINYQNDAQRSETIQAIQCAYGRRGELRVFSFCMRELHNALYVFTRLPDIQVWFSHGVYHPEDVFYLSSLSLLPDTIVSHNRGLARDLHVAKSILFMNEHGLRLSLGSTVRCSEETIRDSVFIPIPIPMTADVPKRILSKVGNIRIICISRFVDFKVAAVLAMMRYAVNRPGVELLVIGHGPWKILLTAWAMFHQARNIEIITGVSPEKLDSFIDSCDVGYAQGTSILEIAKRGLPVLIAPYSRIIDLIDRNFPTLGVFGNIKGVNAFGDVNNLKRLKTYPIDQCMDSVIRDYSSFQIQSADYVKKFASDIVCGQILDFIRTAQYSNQRVVYDPPRAPFLKRLIRKILSFKV